MTVISDSRNVYVNIICRFTSYLDNSFVEKHIVACLLIPRISQPLNKFTVTE